MRACLFLCIAMMNLASEPLRVMTYNVRYPAKDDGPNVWEARKDILVASIRQKNPDLFGTQELFFEQGEYIVQKLGHYAWFGISRRGNREDEHMGIFYRKDRLRLVESGNFWLSETPDQPGSISWNMSLPRMVTWGLFERLSDQKRFYHFNTHFAHRQQDEEPRKKSAAVILERIRKLPASIPFLLTGDFNADAGGDVQKILLTELKDAWTMTAEKRGPNATFHGFTGRPREQRIDWVLFRGPWTIREIETDTYHEGERYPSDHFPIFAVMDLP